MSVYIGLYIFISLLFLSLLVFAWTTRWKTLDYTLMNFLQDAVTSVVWPISAIHILIEELRIGAGVVLVKGEIPEDLKELIKEAHKNIQKSRQSKNDDMEKK